MANQIQMKIEGVDNIIAELEKIASGKNAAERAALRGGGVPIRVAAKRFAKAAKDTGLLEKSIGLNVKKGKDGRLTCRVGPRGGFRKMVKRKGDKSPRVADPLFYSHLVEFGTSHSAAKPYIRPAIEETKGQVISAMGEALQKHLIRKQAREAAKSASA